jgi:hypothetical protein
LGAGGPLDVGQTREASELFDVVLANGRVIDAETKLDAVRNVGIKNGHIAAVSKEQLHGRQLVDVKGLVVAPGFIDWHAHGQNTLADRVQAFDGVTTSLELEAGMLPIARWYDLQAKGKRVVNYGAASSWGVARMATLEDLPLPAEPKATALFANFGLTKWPNDVATSEQVDHIVNLTEQGLKEGGLGIGVVPGCAPGSGYKELLAVHTLAAKYNVPTYSHVRSEGDVDPLSAAQAYGEMLSFAAATAANVHICHLNSTSFRDMPQAVSMIHRGLDQGLNITVEAYPYEAASTGIGAKFSRPRICLVRASATRASNTRGSAWTSAGSRNCGPATLPRSWSCTSMSCLAISGCSTWPSCSRAASSPQMRCRGSVQRLARKSTRTRGRCPMMRFRIHAVPAHSGDSSVSTSGSAKRLVSLTRSLRRRTCRRSCSNRACRR